MFTLGGFIVFCIVAGDVLWFWNRFTAPPEKKAPAVDLTYLTKP